MSKYTFIQHNTDYRQIYINLKYAWNKIIPVIILEDDTDELIITEHTKTENRFRQIILNILTIFCFNNNRKSKKTSHAQRPECITNNK